jgi:hypothetical protein
MPALEHTLHGTDGRNHVGFQASTLQADRQLSTHLGHPRMIGSRPEIAIAARLQGYFARMKAEPSVAKVLAREGLA